MSSKHKGNNNYGNIDKLEIRDHASTVIASNSKIAFTHIKNPTQIDSLKEEDSQAMRFICRKIENSTTVINNKPEPLKFARNNKLAKQVFSSKQNKMAINNNNSTRNNKLGNHQTSTNRNTTKPKEASKKNDFINIKREEFQHVKNSSEHINLKQGLQKSSLNENENRYRSSTINSIKGNDMEKPKQKEKLIPAKEVNNNMKQQNEAEKTNIDNKQNDDLENKEFQNMQFPEEEKAINKSSSISKLSDILSNDENKEKNPNIEKERPASNREEMMLDDIFNSINKQENIFENKEKISIKEKSKILNEKQEKLINKPNYNTGFKYKNATTRFGELKVDEIIKMNIKKSKEKAEIEIMEKLEKEEQQKNAKNFISSMNDEIKKMNSKYLKKPSLVKTTDQIKKRKFNSQMKTRPLASEENKNISKQKNKPSKLNRREKLGLEIFDIKHHYYDKRIATSQKEWKEEFFNNENLKHIKTRKNFKEENKKTVNFLKTIKVLKSEKINIMIKNKTKEYIKMKRNERKKAMEESEKKVKKLKFLDNYIKQQRNSNKHLSIKKVKFSLKKNSNKKKKPRIPYGKIDLSDIYNQYEHIIEEIKEQERILKHSQRSLSMGLISQSLEHRRSKSSHNKIGKFNKCLNINSKKIDHHTNKSIKNQRWKSVTKKIRDSGNSSNPS